jgi:hypothetical protein
MQSLIAVGALGILIGVLLTSHGDSDEPSVHVATAAQSSDEGPDNESATPLGVTGFLGPVPCEHPVFDPADQHDLIDVELPPLVESVLYAWDILTTECTAHAPGFPAFLYEIPVGTIARDPANGHAFLITQQGWKSIPTGGDYLCFQNQGHPVANLDRLTDYLQDMSAGDIHCVVPPTPDPASSPAPPAPTPAPAPPSAPTPSPDPTPTPTNPPAVATYTETTGGEAHTWTNYSNAGGNSGPTIGSNQTVQIACKVTGFRVEDGNTWWYRIASSPWNGAFYVSADAFYNNGSTSGSLHGTPFVDPAVRDC